MVTALLLLSAPAQAQSRGRMVTDSVYAAGLAHNVVGDSPTRRLLVYLPPSYATSATRRYPVLYLLHGATSTPEEFVDGTYQGFNLALAMDSLIAARAVPEYIVVMPHADNALGAGFYANSPATGNWQDFVVRDLVQHVEARYRTKATRAGRALVGHSMGGFGALAIGFTFPRRFGLVYAVSPCCLAFVDRLAPTSPAWTSLAGITRWQDAEPRTRLVLGMAAALDGRPGNARLFDALPYRVAGTAVVPDSAVQSRWLRRMPPALASDMVRRGDRAPVLYMEAGSDETGLLEGVAVLRARLDQLHVRYRDTTFTGGHVDRVRDRFTQAVLPTVGRWFTAPSRTAAAPASRR
jgi:enterochelin esterase-like enzyme